MLGNTNLNAKNTRTPERPARQFAQRGRRGGPCGSVRPSRGKYAGRRGRRPLPCPTTVPPGRARRPRRAASTEHPPGTPTGTPRGCGPPRTSAPTMPHHRVAWSGATSPAHRVHGTPSGDADGNTPCTRAAEDIGPYHGCPVNAMRPGVPPGRARRPRRAAPTERPLGRRRERHGDAGRRGRRPLPHARAGHGSLRRARQHVCGGSSSRTRRRGPHARSAMGQSESAQTIPHATRIIGRSPARRACRTCRASVRPPRGRRAAHPPQTPRGSARGA